MASYEVEVRRIRIFCQTEGCMNTSGGQKSTHRNVKDFTERSKKAAIESFKRGTRINAFHGSKPTQGIWKKTKSGAWLCPKCQGKRK